MEKQKLLMLKGLPGSGKTTHAKKLVDEGYVRVNKDDLREMMDNGKWGKKNEHRVLKIRDAIIRDALNSGKSVVVDDTNFDENHKLALQEIAENHKVAFEILFIDTPLEECIERNNKRERKVPVNVIVGMYEKYIAPYRDNQKEEYNENLEECIVVDVDGTLAHIDAANPRNIYDASRAGSDILDDAVSSVVGMAFSHGYRVIVVTGRHSGHLDVTMDWLKEKGVEYDEIYCRGEGDNRPDTEIKEEIYSKHIKGRYNVKFVIDDRPSVCRMWRRLGMKVFQVGNPHVEF